MMLKVKKSIERRGVVVLRGETGELKAESKTVGGSKPSSEQNTAFVGSRKNRGRLSKLCLMRESIDRLILRIDGEKRVIDI